MDVHLFIGPRNTISHEIAAIYDANRMMLESEGIAVKYLNTPIKSLRDVGIGQDPFLRHAAEDGSTKRLILLVENGLGGYTDIRNRTIFFPKADRVLKQFLDLRGEYRLQFSMCTRAASSLLREVYTQRIQNGMFSSFDAFMADKDITGLKWSGLVEGVTTQLVNAGPESVALPLALFRHEDFPIYWRSIFHAISGCSRPQELRPAIMDAPSALSKEGAGLLMKYLQKHPIKNDAEFKQIHKEFMANFTTDPRRDLADWFDPELLEDCQDHYDDDWYLMSRIENVLPILAPRIYDQKSA